MSSSIMRCLGAAAGADQLHMLLVGGGPPRRAGLTDRVALQYIRAVTTGHLKVNCG